MKQLNEGYTQVNYNYLKEKMKANGKIKNHSLFNKLKSSTSAFNNSNYNVYLCVLDTFEI